MAARLENGAEGKDVIDACVFHEWPTISALGPYLPSGWRELLLEPRTIVSSNRLYRNLSSKRIPPSTVVKI